MNLQELLDQTTNRLDELKEAPAYYSPEEITRALDRAQRFFCAATHGLERIANFTLSSATAFYSVLSHPTTPLTDYLVPLRVTVNGVRLRPRTLHDLAGENDAWSNTPGTPTMYQAKGCDFFAVSPQPTGTTTAVITYAALPAALDLTQPTVSTPEIPAEYHPSLPDGAIFFLKIKEGGQEFLNTLPGLDRFLDDTQQYGEYTTARSLAQQYDAMPYDLASFDRSRLMKPPRQRRGK